MIFDDIISLTTEGRLVGIGDVEAENGITAAIELAIAARLAVLQLNGSTVFRTAKQWNYQTHVTEGGVEAFAVYSPFVFVRYLPQTDGEREGDYDLKQGLRFAVAIGVESKEKGVARIGSDSVLGTSKIRDLVIASLDGWHPGAGFDCDPLYYDDEEQQLDEPNRQALIIYFKCNLITN